MSDTLGFLHDHGYIAWDHFLAEHLDKKNTENFVKAFYDSINVLDAALNELYTKRWIETSEGHAVDGAGAIVGLNRRINNPVIIYYFGFVTQPAGKGFGQARMRNQGELYVGLETNIMGDEEYRSAIVAKIALNNGHGTSEEIIRSIEKATGIQDNFIMDIGNANANLYIREAITILDPAFWIIDKLTPRAAGVKLWMMFAPKPYIFGFLEQKVYYGFGVGSFVQLMAGVIDPIP